MERLLNWLAGTTFIIGGSALAIWIMGLAIELAVSFLGVLTIDKGVASIIVAVLMAIWLLAKLTPYFESVGKALIKAIKTSIEIRKAKKELKE